MGNRSRTLALGNRPQSPKQVGGTSVSGFTPPFKSHTMWTFGQRWVDARGFQLQPAMNMNEEWPMVSTESALPTRFTRVAWKCCDAPCFTERKRAELCRKGQPKRGQRGARGVRVKSVVGARFSQLTRSQRQAHPSPRLPRRATGADPLPETFQVPPGKGNSALINLFQSKGNWNGIRIYGNQLRIYRNW